MDTAENSSLPRRVDGLEVHEVEDGFVIYQEGSSRVHCLNHTAAMVFEFVDGARSAETIASLLARVFGLDAAPMAETEACLEQLRVEGVLR